MDAKCAKCDEVAIYDLKAGVVKCESCGFKASYEEYIELMSGRLEGKAWEYMEKGR